MNYAPLYGRGGKARARVMGWWGDGNLLFVSGARG